jgi:hypothetical protein
VPRPIVPKKTISSVSSIGDGLLMFFQLQVERREDNKDFITSKWVSRAPKKKMFCFKALI